VQNHPINSAEVCHSAFTALSGGMARRYRLRIASILCGLCVLASLVLTPQRATAQYNSGIRGVVNDPSGSVVVGATVTLKNNATGETKTIQSDAQGIFVLLKVRPGEYVLTVQAPGFATFTTRPTLITEQTLNVPVTLAVGQSEQSVMVESTAPLLDTVDSRLQTTLPQNQIDTLPVQGRSVIGLVNLAPGVTGTGLATTSGVPDNFNVETTNQANANGRGFDGNLYVIDGLDITSSVRPGVVNTSPNSDSVQEVALQTNTYSVEYGRATSTETAITTKGGGNRIHGLASYYYTGNRFWARNTFTPVTGYAPFHYNNFSGAVGGPIYKNHAFFFGSAQLLRSLSTTSGSTTFEAPEFIQFAKQQFPNSIGTSLMGKYPVTKATITGTSSNAQKIFGANCGTTATNNIPCTLPVVDAGTYSLSPYRNGTQYSVRVDENFRQERVYASYYDSTLNTLVASVRSGMDTQNYQKSRSFQVNETHTFSPNLLNEAKFGYLPLEGINSVSGQFDVPLINITGLSASLGLGQPHLDFIQHNYHWRDTLSYIKGRHSFRAGFEGFHGDELTLFGQVQSSPVFTFNNLLDLAQDKPFTETGVYYNPVTGQKAFFDLGVSSTTYGIFVQDQWHLASRLTLDLGIRYDNFGNPYPSAALKSIISNFYLGSGRDLTTQVANGVLKVTPGVYNSSPKKFSPRVGVSWDPTGSNKYVVRGGVGVYHEWFTNGELTVPLRANAPAFANPTFFSTQGTPPIFALGTSATYPFNFPIPVVAAGTVDAHGAYSGFPTANIGGTDANLNEPLILNYTAGLERQLGRHLTAGVNYGGSFGHDLPEGDVNTISPNNDINRVTGSLIANKNKLVRPLPSFGAINYTRNGNRSHYNAFIATLNGRFGSHNSFQMSYTRSSAIDYGTIYPENLAPRSTYEGPTSFDFPSHFSMSESLRIPEIFRNNHVVGSVVNGWTVSGSVILQSGSPFTVLTSASFQPVQDSSGNVTGLKTGSGDYNGDGKNYDFPNVPTSGYSQPHDRASYRSGLFAASAFPIPTMGTQGNELRNRFRGPGYANTDLSVMKSFPFRELARFEFRVDMFNLFNRVNLTSFQSDLSNGNFGKATTAFNARYFQFAGRLAF
jgi:outer membrane receptor protein involved in Fe transport